MATATTNKHGPSSGSKAAPAVRRMPGPFWFVLWGRLRGRIWQIGVGSLILVAVLAFVYWRLLVPVAVQSHEVRAGEIVAEVMGTGTVSTHVKTTISANITGLLTDVLFDQGDYVKADQIVARIDDRDLKRQVKVEEANVSARKATVNRLIADKNSARSTLDRASADYERAKRLLPSGSIARAEYDSFVDVFNTAKSGMDRAEAGLVEGQKQLVAAEETAEYQKARLAYTVITAPYDGLIVRRDCDPGAVVVPGTSILSLVSLKEVWISAWVDETMQGRVKPKQSVAVVFRSEPNREFPGTVVRIGRETDPETREFLVDVQPDRMPEQWSVGQRAEVYIDTARKSQATLLPTKFMLRRGGKTGVFVAVQGRAEWRVLRLGLQSRETVEVIEGVLPGEIVVMPADPKTGALADGQRVRLP